MLEQEAILNFIRQMKLNGATDKVVLQQIMLFCDGVRDVRLVDDCIILIDSETTCSITDITLSTPN